MIKNTTKACTRQDRQNTMKIGRKLVEFYQCEQYGGRHVTSDMCECLDFMQEICSSYPSLKEIVQVGPSFKIMARDLPLSLSSLRPPSRFRSVYNPPKLTRKAIHHG